MLNIEYLLEYNKTTDWQVNSLIVFITEKTLVFGIKLLLMGEMQK